MHFTDRFHKGSGRVLKDIFNEPQGVLFLPRSLSKQVKGAMGRVWVITGCPAAGIYRNEMKAKQKLRAAPSQGEIRKFSTVEQAETWFAQQPVYKPPVVDLEESSENTNGQFVSQQATPVFVSQLDDDQKRAYDAAISGKNVFITGSAGVGKSWVLRKIHKDIVAIGRRVAMTASTGGASILMNGSTVHSWSGIGIDNGENPSKTAKSISCRKKYSSRWKFTDCLIIDEVSMIAPEILKLLDYVGQFVRKTQAPFGGMQIILVGDFGQLPPVVKNGRADPRKQFCFQTQVWKEAIHCTILLRQVHRQKDKELVDLLQDIRVNRLTQSSEATLRKAMQNNLRNDKGIEPTRLYSLNRNVDEVNNMKLRLLPGPVHRYKAIDWAADSSFGEAFSKHCSMQDQLDLKVGAQVILLKNIDVEGGLANGSRGVVTALDVPIASEQHSKREYFQKNESGSTIGVEVQFLNKRAVIGNHIQEYSDQGTTVATRKQYPLRLAWAITIHKSQGMTCDLLEVDLKGCFEFGQAYTALSRARSLQSMKVVNFAPEAIMCARSVCEFYMALDGVKGVPSRKRSALTASNSFSSLTSSASSSSTNYMSQSQSLSMKRTKSAPAEGLYSTPESSWRINGSTFVVTGELDGISRTDLVTLVRSKGGAFRSGVSSKTNFLIVGSKANAWARTQAVEESTKYKKAVELGIPRIDERCLQAMANNPHPN